MEFRQLRYFVAIVDNGSLSRAALTLRVAQPALTQQLRQLEETLGVQLLHRSPQGVHMTDAGKVFHEHAQAILQQVAEAQAAVTRSAERPAGNVNLGLAFSVSGMLAVPLLTAVRERYPDVTLQLNDDMSGHLIEQLRAGRINLAVLFDDHQLGGFTSVPLAEEELRFVCRSDDPLAGRDAVTLREALDSTLILPGLQHGVRARIESVARAAGLAPRAVIEINSVTILKSAILAGMGATLLPAAPVLAEVERGDMRALPIHGAPITRTVVLCSSRAMPLSSAAGAVGRVVAEVARGLCDGGAWTGARALDDRTAN